MIIKMLLGVMLIVVMLLHLNVITPKCYYT